MSVRAVVTRLLALGRRRSIDAELAEEIDEHLRLAADEMTAAGLSSAAARAAARRAFGNPTLARESSRDAWRWASMDALLADLRFGVRIFRKHWVTTVVAISALGVGIGVTSAIVSLLDEVVNHAYPYTAPNRIVLLWGKLLRGPRYDQMQISLPELRVWQRDATQASIAGFSWTQSVNVSSGKTPVRSPASLVTSNLLSVLGVAPMLGRDFTPADERDDAPNTAIITYDFWQNDLGGSATALTTPLIIDREPYAIVGVTPRDFRMPILMKVRVLLPARRAKWVTDRAARSIVPIGRLTASATRASVTAELAPITKRFNDDDPRERGGWTVNVEDFRASLRRHVQQSLKMLLGLSLLVLLIACANVAILLLARVPARRQELMLRLALGAERRRIVFQLLAESLMLAVGAAVVGIALARPTMGVLSRLVDGSLPFEWQPSVNVGVALIALAIATATCFIFGVAPAVSVVRSLRATGTLRGTRTSGATQQEWLRSALMTAEVALSLALIVGGWLMVESVLVVGRRQLGFESRDLVTARVLLDTTRYRTGSAQQAFFVALSARLRAHRELRDAAVGSRFPLATAGDLANYVTREATGEQDRPDTLQGAGSVIMGDYFVALHVPVVAGRMFTDGESEPVVVVNERLARQLWGGRDPVGQRLRVLAPMFADGEAIAAGERRVVGVVRDVRASPTHADDAWPNFFVPYSQQPLRSMYVAVRASTPTAGATAIRSEVAALDAVLPIFSVKSIDELMDYWLAPVHLNAIIVDVLAGVGILLTLIGIYSVVAVFVSQRTREIGIRIAVGAQRGQIVRLIAKRTLWPSVIGLAAGTALSLAGTRAFASMLYGVSPLDPRAFVGALVVLVAVVASAAFVPARYAASLDPLEALRLE